MNHSVSTFVHEPFCMKKIKTILGEIFYVEQFLCKLFIILFITIKKKGKEMDNIVPLVMCP